MRRGRLQGAGCLRTLPGGRRSRAACSGGGRRQEGGSGATRPPAAGASCVRWRLWVRTGSGAPPATALKRAALVCQGLCFPGACFHPAAACLTLLRCKAARPGLAGQQVCEWRRVSSSMSEVRFRLFDVLLFCAPLKQMGLDVRAQRPDNTAMRTCKAAPQEAT